MNSTKPASAGGARIARRTVLMGLGAGAASFYFPAAHASGSSTIKIGWIAPLSGPGALFGVATDFVHKQLDKLFSGGLEIGGKTYSVQIELRDSRSDVNTATQAAIGLMTSNKVDLIVASDAVAAIGAGRMAIVNKTPILSTILPADAVVGMLGGPKNYSNNGTPWNFHFCFASTDISETYLGMWAPYKAQLDDKVAVSFVDQAAARGFADPQHGLPAYLTKGGYQTVDGGMFKMGTSDFSNQVNLFKTSGCQILSGFMFADNFAALWRTAAQTGYKPEIATVAGAFLFPGGIDALGDRGDGLSTEVWWSPKLPYHSTLTGQSAQALATQWESAEQRQWTPVLGYTHAVWEVAVQALKSSGAPGDSEALRKALQNIDMETIIGKVDFAHSEIPGIAQTTLSGGQWRRRKGGKYKYELEIVYKGPKSPEGLEVDGDLTLLSKL